MEKYLLVTIADAQLLRLINQANVSHCATPQELVLDNDDDVRTKRVTPTAKFTRQLNYHLHLFRQLCNSRFFDDR